ncbi:hypothetical protein [Accumulibacter sp.]|uniref:hypothetical protein n=1 Tax=Accumulibacter sp. TaxID=2053492 RepID=UPI001AD44950|nr:hypothetical protein [Accumulibacter sp.]MBN8453102.1 hypothetical protein [Accumulibacter sp.]MBO3706570.1 hypothetical protein [Candidatus Accumulibacter conexus]
MAEQNAEIQVCRVSAALAKGHAGGVSGAALRLAGGHHLEQWQAQQVIEQQHRALAAATVHHDPRLAFVAREDPDATTKGFCAALALTAG